MNSISITLYPIFFYFVCSITSISLAHAPEGIHAKRIIVGKESGMQLSITHHVDNPKKHHVARVEISVGTKGKTIYTQTFDAQTDTDSLDIFIPDTKKMRFKKGRIITVTASCCKTGTYTQSVRIE